VEELKLKPADWSDLRRLSRGEHHQHDMRSRSFRDHGRARGDELCLRWKLLRMFGTTEIRVLRLIEWPMIDQGGTGDMNCVDIV
jgi:hypothetical protein